VPLHTQQQMARGFLDDERLHNDLSRFPFVSAGKKSSTSCNVVDGDLKSSRPSL